MAILRRACEFRQIRVENRQLKQEIRKGGPKPAVTRPIGKSRRFLEILRLADIVAPTVQVTASPAGVPIDPRQIDLLGSCFDDARTELATLIKRIASAHVLFSPNSPKVIVDQDQFAIYFSRHPIPFIRGVEESSWLGKHTFFQHIGIYGYRPDTLKKITALSPSSLERAESLEQLRWLENGFKIKTAVTTFETIAIDTPEDLERLLKH